MYKRCANLGIYLLFQYGGVLERQRYKFLENKIKLAVECLLCCQLFCYINSILNCVYGLPLSSGLREIVIFLMRLCHSSLRCWRSSFS